ncbi:acyl CoA:acetate/3-ketoacid CoA transferase [Maledivibacter halophilus]|uniref:Propionate CoA-transferase n=1 Tax=Maledivibacter halophilus TaxID=36842 RepID=A0A1T5IAU9_9FIRM|nr:acyl CoA:acetate/3-ketoacid CoA transferase [Maledivibacter halophilus]SKC36299.1 propionate CoA-transferase [Maledivibacter halophilus]
MNNKRVLTAKEAVDLIENGQTVVTGGFVSSCCPEALTSALEERFINTGLPKDLTLVFAAGQGKRDGRGNDHFAHEKMVKKVIGGHWDRGPKLGAMAIENKIEAYNFPQGVISHLFRDIAAKKIGTITHVGLNTFVDPRNGGGKLNSKTKEDLVKLIEIEGQERLLYKSFPIDICLIRGTYADESGNVTVEKEIGSLDSTAMAQACKNSGGKVIVQVEKIVKNGSLDPKLVKIPRIYVDALVIGDKESSLQCLGCEYDPSLTGELRVPLDGLNPAPLNARKVIARRAAMELKKDAVVNLGVGVPELISSVAAEEGIEDYMTLTVEAGAIGGMPMPGAQFGASSNVESILDQNVLFDFYDGGGLDIAYLGMAQIDEIGNINVSKFGTRLAGCGGFINITQNAKKVVFCGTFTAGGLKTEIKDGKLHIIKEGKMKKFIKNIEQITFSGIYANKVKQPVMYITERAVFELREEGLYLTEIAPGIDIQTQILDKMEFKPKIEKEPKLMDERLFSKDIMGLAKDRI